MKAKGVRFDRLHLWANLLYLYLF